MKTLIPAAIRCSLMFTAITALSIVYPASVQAVPTTYQYTGNHFTVATALYTTSDFVTAMVTLAEPLAPNLFRHRVTPTAFRLSDGVQTMTNLNAANLVFYVHTDASAAIQFWILSALPLMEHVPYNRFGRTTAGTTWAKSTWQPEAMRLWNETQMV